MTRYRSYEDARELALKLDEEPDWESVIKWSEVPINEEVLIKLAQDFDQRVALAIAQRRELPSSVVTQLIQHPKTTVVSLTTAHHPLTEEDYAILASHHESEIREQVASESRSSQTLSRLTDDTSESVLCQLAQNQAASRGTVEKLAGSSYGMVASMVVGRYDLGIRAMLTLASHPDPSVREELAKTALPEVVMEKIAEDEDPKVVRTLCDRALPQLIAEKISQRPEVIIQAIAAKQPLLSLKTLVTLSVNNSETVRANIAINQSTPDALLNNLFFDGNSLVALFAEEELEKRGKIDVIEDMIFDAELGLDFHPDREELDLSGFAE